MISPTTTQSLSSVHLASPWTPPGPPLSSAPRTGPGMALNLFVKVKKLFADHMTVAKTFILS